MVRGAPVERGVEVELDRVALDEAVAAAERDGGRLGVVADGAEIEVLVVPQHAKGSLDRGGLALVGVDLREIVLKGRGLPRRLVHQAVRGDGPGATPRAGTAHIIGFGRERPARWVFFRERVCGR